MATSSTRLAPDDAITGTSDELAEYLQNKFSAKRANNWPAPAADEPYVGAWATYLNTYPEEDAFQLLRKCYPQLNFPIAEGVNKSQAYIDAVLKGKPLRAGDETASAFNSPERMCIRLHDSVVGKVPVLIVPDAADFTTLVRCFLHKNNPAPVPNSMGALLANGINNWERLHARKEQWLQTNAVETWAGEFSRNIVPNPGLYKDKLIVLSTKPYSNVPADKLGLSKADWADYSLSIRLEHECAHLYTLKRYGCASNNLHDELIADYVGISKTIGRYEPSWMLAFMGLEAYPAYRKGARLENYLGDKGLTTNQFHQLIALIKKAIESIADFDAQVGPIRSAHDQVNRIDALCMTNLTDMASAKGTEQLLQTYEETISA
jgi:hypothetical protein